MTLAGLALIGFAAVLVAAVVVTLVRTWNLPGVGKRLADQHASVTARVVELLAWTAVCIHGARLPGRRFEDLLRGAVTGALALAVVGIPVLAVFAEAQHPVADHGLAAGIGALVWGLVLEAPALPDRLSQLWGTSWAPTTNTRVGLIALSAALDAVFAAWALEASGDTNTRAAFVGMAYVAMADLVSLAVELFCARPADYPLAP